MTRFETRWDEKCESSVRPKAEAQAAGEEVPSMADELMGKMEGGGFSMEKFFSGKDKNYTDVYMRCCGEDLSDCNCPVRLNETYAEKWENSCETKLAYKAGIKEYDGSGATYGDMTGSSSFGDMGMMMEKFFGKDKNYTDVYDRCCSTQEGLFATSYDEDVTSCNCPVRQKEELSEKWSTSCAEKIAPKVMEEMSG